jgi:DNA-binding NtrC family response regulator
MRKIHIQKVLQMCNGNRLRAAQILGIDRTSLYRYRKRDEHYRPQVRSRRLMDGPSSAADWLSGGPI